LIYHPYAKAKKHYELEIETLNLEEKLAGVGAYPKGKEEDAGISRETYPPSVVVTKPQYVGVEHSKKLM